MTRKLKEEIAQIDIERQILVEQRKAMRQTLADEQQQVNIYIDIERKVEALLHSAEKSAQNDGVTERKKCHRGGLEQRMPKGEVYNTTMDQLLRYGSERKSVSENKQEDEDLHDTSAEILSDAKLENEAEKLFTQSMEW